MDEVQSVKNSKKETEGWFKWVLKKLISESFTRLLIVAGVLVIIIGFFLFLWGVSWFHFDTSIDNDRIGQMGDFIGGVAGSLWALAGVILFYIALVDQRKEFKKNVKLLEDQKVELNLQRKEFEVNRLMTMVYKQIDRIDKKLEKTMILSEAYLIERLNDERGEYDFLSSSLSENSSKLYSIFNVLLQSQEVIMTATHTRRLQGEMLSLLSGNLDTTFANMARNIVKFYEEYESQIFPNPHSAKNHEIWKSQIKRLVDIIQKIRFLAVSQE